MKNNQNHAWYIVPFSVEDENIDEWNKHINNNFIKSDIIITRYFFTYITDIFKKNKFACSYEIPKSYIKDIKINKLKSADTSSVKVETAFLFMFNKNIGFLIYKIFYGDLSYKEIENFSFDFKRCTKNRFSNDSFEGNNLIDINKRILTNTLANPFFYSSNECANNCNIFQFIYTDNENTDISSLARGYRNSMEQNIESIKESKFDMYFSAHPYIEWAGCQSVLVCLANTNPSVCSKENLNFIQNIFPISIENDYLFMYLLLLSQRYTLMYYISKLTEYKNDYKQLTKLEEDLTLFKLESCFNVISNELTYQNIYDQIYKVLDINMLFNDIQDINQRLVQHEREIDFHQESKMQIIIALLSAFSILSVFIDIFTDHFNKPIWIPIVICSMIFIFLIYYIFHYKQKRKHNRK